MTPLPNKTQLRHKGPEDVIELGHYVAAMAGKFKISDEAAKKTLTNVRAGEGAIQTEDKAENKRLAEAHKQIKSDWASHVSNKKEHDESVESEKAAAKEKREKDKAEKTEKKASFALALKESVEDEELSTIIRTTQDKMDEALESTLGECFTIKDNQVIVKKGKKPTKEDFGHAFAAFINVVEAGEAFSDSAAKREAQLAIIARDAYGDEWISFFSDRKKDGARINKYMKAFDVAGELEVTDVLTSMPLNNFRVISENLLVPGDKDKNIAAKKKLFAHMQKKFGSSLPVTTQTELKNEVQKYKTSIGLEQEVKYSYIGLFRHEDKNVLRQLADVTEEILMSAVYVFNRKFERVTWNEDQGKVQLKLLRPATSDEIEALTSAYAEEKATKAAEDEVKEKKPAKKAPAPAKPDAKKKEPEPEEVEDEPEDETPKAKAKVAPSKKKAPEPEPEEEEEPEPDEDEAPTPKAKDAPAKRAASKVEVEDDDDGGDDDI